MFSRIFHLVAIVSIFAAGSAIVSAQAGADNKNVFSKPGDDDKDRPTNFRENLEKLRIEKEKKDFDQMLERGQELVKLTEDLEKDVDASGRLDEKDKPKLTTVEKLAKKIRTELGGGDDDSDEMASQEKPAPLSPVNAIKSLRTTTQKLYEELKKTSRFSISAAAIQTSNAVLKITKFLKISD